MSNDIQTIEQRPLSTRSDRPLTLNNPQANTMRSESTAPKQRGRPFPKGQGGNPKGRPPGARNAAIVLVEQLIDGEAEALTRKVITKAKQGSLPALRVCLDRIPPPLAERPVHFTLPELRLGDNASRQERLLAGSCDALDRRGSKKIKDNPMSQDTEARLRNLRRAPRCAARTRTGTACQRPALHGRRRCRLHGGLSPGAPRGHKNGNYKNGNWTADAIEERRWLRSLVQLFSTTG
jgi:Family of unknown function (DUF5681)